MEAEVAGLEDAHADVVARHGTAESGVAEAIIAVAERVEAIAARIGAVAEESDDE
jgi:hypothetical protein